MTLSMKKVCIVLQSADLAIPIAKQFFMNINMLKLTGTPGPPLSPLCPAGP